MNAPRPLYCDFCGKSQHEVKLLIAGPVSNICDTCVDQCHEIVVTHAPSLQDNPTPSSTHPCPNP